MKELSRFLAAVLLVAMAEPVYAGDERTAVPLTRPAPVYPAACVPAEGESIGPQTVTVRYDVNRDGRVENVGVVESTNPCFDDVSVATVRGWSYKERRAQSDLETTFTYVLSQETQAVDFDVRILYREPPLYPNRCQRRAGEYEWVVLEYDISSDGIPENISIYESSNSCFDSAAVNAVKKWRFRPRLINGEPALREGFLTQITFRLASRASIRPEFRKPVFIRLKRAERLLNSGETEKALEVLDNLERRFGDDFSQKEQSTFLRLRAGVKIAMNDYAGALDDLRTVQKIGLAGQSNEEVGKLIVQLEEALAAQAQEQAGGSIEDPALTEEE